MKARFSKWAQLGIVRKPEPAPPAEAVLIRTMPGFNAVEDAALLYGVEQSEKLADHFTKRHFGIEAGDVDDLRPVDDMVIDETDLAAERRKHPDRLLVDYLADDETIEYLLTLGFDLRDERGQPVRSAPAIAAQVEAAARGMAGKLPDRSAIEVENFEQKFAAEAEAFMAQKRARR